MKIDYNIPFNNERMSLVFFRWLPNEKDFMKLTTDDFISIDDISVSEKDGLISYSHAEEPKFYKNVPSNLSEIADEYKFLLQITFEKIDYFKTKLITSKKMQSIKLMTYDLVSKDKKSSFEEWELDKRFKTIHTMVIKPIKILEKECEDGKYELNLLIKEFLRDSKLDDLGI